MNRNKCVLVFWAATPYGPVGRYKRSDKKTFLWHLTPVLSQMNPTYNLTSYFFKIHLDIKFLSVPRSPWKFLSVSPTKNSCIILISLKRITEYMSFVCSSLMGSPQHNLETCTNYQAPHYAVSCIVILLPSSQFNSSRKHVVLNEKVFVQ